MSNESKPTQESQQPTPTDRYKGKGLRSPSCADPKAGGPRYVPLYTGNSGPDGCPLRAKYRAPHKR